MASSAGIANPTPIFAPIGEISRLLIPITSPLRLNNGPPELPGLIAVSVWINRSYAPPDPILRCNAETMPAVTVLPRPSGLPMAITQSPTRLFFESAIATNGSPTALILSNAMSDDGSRPTISALYSLPSNSVTVTLSTASPAGPPATTWLLVTI